MSAFRDASAPELVGVMANSAHTPFNAFGMVSQFILTAQATSEDGLEDSALNAKLREPVKRCTQQVPTERPNMPDLKAEATKIRKKTYHMYDF